MSTVASSNADLTINADGSGNDIKFQSNGTEVGSINSSGTMTATAFSGDGSALTGISSGGGSGTVTSVDITSTNGTIDTSGGAITSSGTLDIDLPSQGTSGTYTSADISVDDYGRITSASSGSGSSGKVLQVVDTTVTAESFSTTSTSDTEITGLSASITPSATTSKIKVTVMVTGGGGNNNHVGYGIKRGSTQIGSSANASGSQRNAIAMGHHVGDEGNFCLTYFHVDSPSTTSATTYKATISNRSGYTFYLNRSPDTNTSKQQLIKTVSKIILEEIGA